MADFELLAPGGHQKLVDEVVDRLDLKADIDGYYAQLTAGAADNLTARGDAVEASFIRRTSGGINDIESGNATIKSIKGNTVRWNQLAEGWNGGLSHGLTFTVTNSLQSVTGTADGNASARLFSRVVNVGHKYLAAARALRLGSTNTAGVRVVRNYAQVVILYQNAPAAIVDTSNWVSTDTIAIQVSASSGTVADLSFYPQLFDLTAMFGAGNEPETVAEFEAMYPESYYAYDAGTLKPVQLEGIETTGFNQWDVSTDGEQYEGHYYIDGTANGYAKTANTNYNCYCVPVFPSTEYCLSVDTGNIGQVANRRYLDADKQFISGSVDGYGSPYAVFTTPANARYVELAISTTSTKNHCINLSWSGRRNGEYEPYWKAERAIAASTYFPTGLKKAGSVYDELTATEAIQRVGEVDLGTLTWTQEGAWQQSKGLTRLSATISDAATASSENVTASGYFESNLTVIGSTMSAAYCIAMMNGRVYVTMPYPEINTGSNFTTWLASHPTTIYYELATPVVTPIDSINLTYKVDDWGTETITGPLGAAPDMDIIYGMNAVDTIRRLPDLYAGKAETEQALAGKADVDGYYSQMTVGAADNLTGRGDTTTAEFLYRTAGGTADIETGQAVAKSVKGNTLVWNQLVNYGIMWGNGSTLTTSGNTVTATSTITSGTYFGVAIVPTARHIAANGHKYYIVADVDLSGITDQTLSKVAVSFGSLLATFVGTYSLTASGRIACIATTNATGTGGSTYINVLFSSAHDTSGQSFAVTNAMVMDLTAMFGAGSEPSTVAELEALYSQPYYEYDAGSLLPVNMDGIETVGFNQWDEEWEAGAIDGTTGQNVASSSIIRSKNYIPVFPGVTYYFKCGFHPGQGSNPSLRFYDADKNFIGIYAASGAITPTNSAFTVPDNAHYLRFNMQTTYGNVYRNDICINLSWSGRRNGEYEPYWSAQRLIDVATYFPDGMRSAGTVRDELTSTEVITRVGVVDLGTLTWTYSNGFFRTSDLNSVILRPASNYTAADAKCSKYEVGAWSSELDKSVMVGKDAGNPLLVKDTDYTDAAAFKAAMSGVMLHYALAEPTVTPIDPPLNLSYRVDDFGTERVMVPEEERSAPPVLDIAYGLNVVDFVRRAPSEYISAASFAQYLLARDAHDGTTTTMTWDDTDNRYEFAITDVETEG